jgi:hypothetical protein
MQVSGDPTKRLLQITLHIFEVQRGGQEYQPVRITRTFQDLSVDP